MDKITIWKLNPTLKNYAWGSRHAFSELFNMPNPHHDTQAELWMGAHPNGVSTVSIKQQNIPLTALFNAFPGKILGSKKATLPFLVKVIAAEKALSIQVHPDKRHAMAGFSQENQQNIAQNAPNRNYHDPNHKPELVYALTPFLALKGFRSIPTIMALFKETGCAIFDAQISKLRQNPTSDQLNETFAALFTITASEKRDALKQLTLYTENNSNDLTKMLHQLLSQYPDDIGVFAPLFFNPILLSPGQAMFIAPGTLHTYLHGVALEIMTNSDNVIRAGLTPKHIDIPALLDNTRFESLTSDNFTVAPTILGHKTLFAVPVADFQFEVIQSNETERVETVTGAEILFCLAGEIKVQSGATTLQIRPGESIFVGAHAGQYHYCGQGQFARAYSQ